MTRILFAALAASATLLAVPAAAHDDIYVDGYRAPISPNNDSNKWWLDYRTDISEAKRELRSDLRRATDEEDRRDAYEEYRQEIRDAKHDYTKEMRERGYRVVSFRENRRRMARR
ncbi:hypothetical protein [uncultured Erythrobacter sp.]|uniref:hypothetical protein n=1 Tax=uncultured Erythrobacter sp. TaxID=263913 RepID=UPI00262CDD29|nr:hypothetical protein [uncultured Erythrobacter sp.]